MKTIASATKGLLGQLCWGVQWERQLNMSMSFGEPQLRVREPHVSKSRNPRIRELASSRRVVVRGNWWLWIFCAYWKIVIPDSVTAMSSSPLHVKRKAMGRLDGQKVKRICVDADHGFTEFTFDLGAILQVRRFQADDADIWTLYKPSGYVVGLRGDGTFTHSRGTTPGELLVPLPLKEPNHRIHLTAASHRVYQRVRT